MKHTKCVGKTHACANQNACTSAVHINQIHRCALQANHDTHSSRLMPLMYTCMHQMCMCTLQIIHPHTYKHVHVHIHTHTCTHTHIHTHTHTQTHTHIHTHTHTNTHTNTNTCILVTQALLLMHRLYIKCKK